MDGVLIKLIEVVGREVRPAAFAIFLVATLALGLTYFKFEVPLERPVLMVSAMLAFVYWAYSPVASWISQKQKSSSQLRGVEGLRKSALLLSRDAQAILYMWLKANEVSFVAKVNDPIIRELDEAGFIVPVMHQEQRYQLSGWYFDFAISQRTWLLKNLGGSLERVKSPTVKPHQENRV